MLQLSSCFKHLDTCTTTPLFIAEMLYLITYIWLLGMTIKMEVMAYTLLAHSCYSTAHVQVYTCMHDTHIFPLSKWSKFTCSRKVIKSPM